MFNGTANALDHSGMKHRPVHPASFSEGGHAVPVLEVAVADTLHDRSKHSNDLGPGMATGVLASARPTLDTPEPHVQLTEPPIATSAFSEALSRGRWLLGLLVLQSTSSFVLDSYKDLLREHLVVTLFLTMLVGAGGNAGNQSAIKVIRALATGSIRLSWQSFKNMMAQQSAVALMLGGGLSLGGFVRVYVTSGHTIDALAISLSLLLIVLTSVVLGTGLPFLLARAGVDPANAGTSIQVVMFAHSVAPIPMVPEGPGSTT